MTYFDALSSSYGIETVGGVMQVLLPKNSTSLSKKVKIFTTYTDNQTSALVSL